MIWIIKHNPNREPKFHIVEILDGEGRSIKELLIILIRGEVFRKGIFICYSIVRNGPLLNSVIFTIAINVINKYRIIKFMI